MLKLFELNSQRYYFADRHGYKIMFKILILVGVKDL